jgi:putative flippase GtrA
MTDITNPAKLTHRDRVVQFLEYLVGGGLYFVSGYAFFALFYSVFGWNWWQSKIVADIIGWTLNYLVQRYWAFQNKNFKKHEAQNRERYIVFCAVNILLDYLIIGGLQMIGISPYYGMFIAAGYFTIWNYLGYRFWVFREEYNRTQA